MRVAGLKLSLKPAITGIFSRSGSKTQVSVLKENIWIICSTVFYRIEHQLSPGGTGIGLALTKEMVQLLQGTISVESIKGEGSEFTVLLPVTRNAPLSDITEAADLIKVTDDQYDKASSYAEPLHPLQTPKELLTVGAIVPG